MSKAVVTILGIQGGYVSDNKAHFTNKENIAEYKYHDNTKVYFNTLPLLYDSFYPEYEIVPLFTKDSKIFNQTVLAEFYKDKEVSFNDDFFIQDESDFNEVFSLFNRILAKYDEVIIDVTHGFRHLPLLMLINLMMINIKDIHKVKKILFAKEIKKHTKDKQGFYEVIDLKEYLDLANLTYALSTFTQNYTVPNNIKTSNPKYQEFLEELGDFSEHMLANSLDELFISSNKRKSLSEKLLNRIDMIVKEDTNELKDFSDYLNKIRLHIGKLRTYNNMSEYKKMYHLSKNMLDKGYLLNSITLLSEATGIYCSVALKNIAEDVAKKIEMFEDRAKKEKNNANTPFKFYDLYNQSKVLYKVKPFKYKGTFLKVETKNSNNKDFLLRWNDEAKDITEIILENIKQDNKIRDLIYKIDDTRNNLAHANTSQRLKDVQHSIDTHLENFKKMCIDENILEAKS